MILLLLVILLLMVLLQLLSSTLNVDDKNIELGAVATPTDTTADGGGLTLKGDTDKTFNWVNATDAWTSSEHIDLASGKEYHINGTSVLIQQLWFWGYWFKPDECWNHWLRVSGRVLRLRLLMVVLVLRCF
jgi:hypothetical protein